MLTALCKAWEMRVALILAKYIPFYGIVPVIVPSVLLDVPNPLDEIPTQWGTDLDYVVSLAQTVGYTFFIQAGPVVGMDLEPGVNEGSDQPGPDGALMVSGVASAQVAAMKDHCLAGPCNHAVR